uniref:Uncharacterized protein n=1 Tax=Myoviridae sp. ctxlX31 TaxID=2827293 RepID=A0A8S5R510_9CAUD|nr:MAG TPA: hypothetical protein [Myoviridae sp. ctxlX31]
MFHRLYGFTSFCQANASAPRLHSFLPLASLSPFFPPRHIIARHITIVKQIINVFAIDTTLCTSFLLNQLRFCCPEYHKSKLYF